MLLEGACALWSCYPFNTSVSHLLPHSVKLPAEPPLSPESECKLQGTGYIRTSANLHNPKDQSILTTAPEALLVDDEFVDLCCSHLALLFPSAVPSLGERSHLAGTVRCGAGGETVAPQSHSTDACGLPLLWPGC